MAGLIRKVRVWFLVAVLLVSFYMGVVPTMELVSNRDLIKSVNLYDGGNRVATTDFEVSDVLVLRVDVQWANAYSLTISNKTCDVFTKNGGIDGSQSILNLVGGFHGIDYISS